MSFVVPRSNDALNINPPSGSEHLVTHGSDWLWAVTAIYIVSFLAVAGLAYFARAGERIFHYLFTISLLVGSIAYYAQASDLSGIPVQVSDNLSDAGTRQIFFAKYINWFVGWTPLVLAVGLISGVSWATIVYNIALLWTWIGSWLSGAYTSTNYKWGFFAFGVTAYFLLVASFFIHGSVTAKRIGVARHYSAIAGWLSFLWLLYPIAWGLDDGGNEIGVTSGFIFWGILDILTVPVVAFAILIVSSRWDYRSLNLYFTQYGRVAQGGNFPEKAAPVSGEAAQPAVVEGAGAV